VSGAKPAQYYIALDVAVKIQTCTPVEVDGEKWYIRDFRISTHHVEAGGEAVQGAVEYSLELYRYEGFETHSADASLSPRGEIELYRKTIEW
jgi:hypothetical protein